MRHESERLPLYIDAAEEARNAAMWDRDRELPEGCETCGFSYYEDDFLYKCETAVAVIKLMRFLGLTLKEHKKAGGYWVHELVGEAIWFNENKRRLE